MKKKTLITAVAAVLAVAAAGTGTVFALQEAKLRKYGEMKLSLPNSFTVTAHTGCMGTRDNSLEAIKTGAQYADIVEFDLRFGGDGTPILTHDEPTGDEVTLEEAFSELKAHGGLRANVDAKEKTDLGKVWDTAVKLGVQDRIFFTGIEPADIETVKKDAPEIPFYLNLAVDKKKKDDISYISQLVKAVEDAGAAGINLSMDGASETLIKAFREKGLLVSVWTADKELDMHKMLTLAPDNITTREPKKLREIISERA